ncbi:MAG TPA: sigma-70 family RNA polymerase sigma factor [Chloroflexia bacterium]|nr:sigma-70 family RNA polymerase sigma factor [Chloroflexia bacterium]
MWLNNHEKQALFEEVAMAHLSGLYYAALRLCGNPADAEDLVQETYTKAYRAFESFALGSNARAWLYRIMNNTFLSARVRAESRLTRPFSLTPPVQLFRVRDETSPDPAEIVSNRSLDSRLGSALAMLPDEMRTTLVMVDVGGFTYDEAANILGCPVGTVRSRLHRARSILRVHLTEQALPGADEGEKAKSEDSQDATSTGAQGGTN